MFRQTLENGKFFNTKSISVPHRERERERERALYKEYAYCISFKELKGPFQQVDSFTQI